MCIVRWRAAQFLLNALHSYELSLNRAIALVKFQFKGATVHAFTDPLHNHPRALGQSPLRTDVQIESFLCQGLKCLWSDFVKDASESAQDSFICFNPLTKVSPPVSGSMQSHLKQTHGTEICRLVEGVRARN